MPSRRRKEIDLEQPMTKAEFMTMLEDEALLFRALPPTTVTKSFEEWFEDFESDVFAPTGP